ncbi:MAG: hypothetical protein II859_04400 [Bacteroidales bacterium]|nr:hypothetical protein [Bacteroidales bacterium]
MIIPEIHNSTELIELIERIGFLPLLDSSIRGFCMATRFVTEDFIYPRDKHGNRYGWGWSLLTTPERLYGRDACRCDRTPEESFERIMNQLHSICPNATKDQLTKILK